jgi:predicted nucleotidyltransferase
MNTLNDLKAVLPEICPRYGIQWVDVFGSVAREEQRPESDIDLIVEFGAPRRDNISARFFGFLHEMEARYHTRIDILTENSLKNPYLKAEIARERIRVYGH